MLSEKLQWGNVVRFSSIWGHPWKSSLTERVAEPNISPNELHIHTSAGLHRLTEKIPKSLPNNFPFIFFSLTQPIGSIPRGSKPEFYYTSCTRFFFLKLWRMLFDICLFPLDGSKLSLGSFGFSIFRWGKQWIILSASQYRNLKLHSYRVGTICCLSLNSWGTESMEWLGNETHLQLFGTTALRVFLQFWTRIPVKVVCWSCCSFLIPISTRSHLWCALGKPWEPLFLSSCS